MDIMQLLRMKGIFGSPEMGGPTGMGTPPFVPGQVNFPTQMPDFQAPPIQQPPSVSMPQPEFDASARMAQLYNPETAATDKFNELINSMPRIQDYKPNLMGRIGGGLMSLASSMGPQGSIHFNPQGIQEGMNFMNRPYIEQMTDWKNQTGPAYQSAQLERYNNANERTMAYQTVNQDRLYSKQQQDNEVRESRLALQRWKAENPNSKFDFSGPTVKVADPATGQITDTGIPTGRLSDSDKIEAQTQGRVTAIRETGSQSRQTEGTRQENRATNIEAQAWGDPVLADDPDTPGRKIAISINKITGDIKQHKITGLQKVGTDTDKTSESSSQMKVNQFNRARQYAQEHPEVAKYIKLNPTGNDFQISASSTGGMFSSGPTKEQRDAIVAFIYGQDAPKPATSRETPTAASTTAPMKKTQRGPGGATRTIESTDGGKTWHLASK